jgi:2-dehydro-3-deoxyglucarate aldolase/4-hydroxy-2-oxoheptanedioate aldolase
MDSITRFERFRARLRRGDPLAGGWVSIPHPAVAELTAGMGYDFVTIDVEHAPVGVEGVEAMVRAVDAAPGATVPLVRPAAADPVRIKRLLDVGVGGLVVPRVDTAADARRVVEASTYPPTGIRGTGVGRASDYGADLQSYLDRADGALARIVQIETVAGVENADAIAAVEGVDALFVGPVDLSAALDTHLDYDSDAFEAAVESVVTAAAAASTPVGIFATAPGRLPRWRELGFDFVVLGFDAAFLRAGNRRLLAEFDEMEW